ncbi:MAG TPA: lyase [Gammaproteobacteria bacterium]
MIQKPFLVFLLLFVFLSGNAVENEVQVEIREWLVPWSDTEPRSPAVDKKGRIWFCGRTGHYLAYFNPESGKFKKFELDDKSMPQSLIINKKGQIWFSDPGRGYIGRLLLKSGKVEKYPMPENSGIDPYTLVFNDEGDIWFTAIGANAIGKLDTASGEVKYSSLETEAAKPLDIKLDSGERPWVSLSATNRLATIDTETFEVTEYEMSNQDIRPGRIAITSYNKIWFVDTLTGKLGRFNPKRNIYSQRTVPGGESAIPSAIIVDENDWLWFVETGLNPNRLVSYNPWDKEFTYISDIPSGGDRIDEMFFDKESGQIWFGSNTNFIGRAKLP